jgi:alkanesulfonate monooxygenase
VPVEVGCWEAWITCSMIAAHTKRLKPLLAARPGYIVPTMMAKMVSTFDQLSGGRVSINLIAGPGGAQQAMDGITYVHDERYEVMDEGVQIMKRVWTEREPVSYTGKHFEIDNAVVLPRPLQEPHPLFYIGGESDAARDVGAKHANVFLVWGDTVEKTAKKIEEIRARAAGYGRADDLAFGMRLQIVVRDTEDEAWEAADALIADTTDEMRARREKMWEQSQANDRMWELTKSEDYRIAPHLWSGISTVRPGAGVAVVGDPRQVADTLQQFVDIGCTEFCLSGCPHAREAERFGRLVMPLSAGRLAAATVPA